MHYSGERGTLPELRGVPSLQELLIREWEKHIKLMLSVFLVPFFATVSELQGERCRFFFQLSLFHKKEQSSYFSLLKVMFFILVPDSIRYLKYLSFTCEGPPVFSIISLSAGSNSDKEQVFLGTCYSFPFFLTSRCYWSHNCCLYSLQLFDILLCISGLFWLSIKLCLVMEIQSHQCYTLNWRSNYILGMFVILKSWYNIVKLYHIHPVFIVLFKALQPFTNKIFGIFLSRHTSVVNDLCYPVLQFAKKFGEPGLEKNWNAFVRHAGIPAAEEAIWDRWLLEL